MLFMQQKTEMTKEEFEKALRDLREKQSKAIARAKAKDRQKIGLEYDEKVSQLIKNVKIVRRKSPLKLAIDEHSALMDERDRRMLEADTQKQKKEIEEWFKKMAKPLVERIQILSPKRNTPYTRAQAKHRKVIVMHAKRV